MLPAQKPEPGSPMDKFQTVMKVLLKVPKAELDQKLIKPPKKPSKSPQKH